MLSKWQGVVQEAFSGRKTESSGSRMGGYSGTCGGFGGLYLERTRTEVDELDADTQEVRAARTDANQAEIVAVLRKVGATVHSTHKVGQGFPDLVIGFMGSTILAEVKDGSKPESARKLRPSQVEFRDKWRGGPILILTSPDQAIASVLTVCGAL